MKERHILAIESSCDETSAAVFKEDALLSNVIATQSVHEAYGGVVPEFASRAHMQHIVPVVDTALKKANIDKTQLSAIAFTQAPGLIGSLLVGSSFAKGMAQALKLPLIGVNHMRAHILAHFIEVPKPSFPFLCLTVSGGHTQIVLCKDHLHMEILGETLDDAAGEAFDKIAKMMDLPYPGGPLVDQLAKKGDASKFHFPISEVKNYDFSFSGVKTSVLYFLQRELKKDPQFIERHKSDLCASVQHTIVATLMQKLEKAANDLKINEVGIAGGVSANSGLRASLKSYGDKNGWNTYVPKFEYCTDNAAMIGMAAYYQLEAGQFVDLDAVPSARAEW